MRSHSYVAALDAPERVALLHTLEETARAGFPESHMEIPYETWLWVGRRRA